MNTLLDVKISKTQIQRLSQNLQTLLYEQRLSENDVAHALNLPTLTVRRIVSGETLDPRLSTLKLIADYFNVTIDFLIGDATQKVTNIPNKNMPQFVPVLDWNLIVHTKSVKKLDLSTWKNWHPIVLGEQYILSPYAFALESRPSMQPRFPLGTLFIIEPDEAPRDGDIVLIKMKNNGDISPRELIIDPPKWQLQPIVAGSEVIFYDESQHEIIGIVILSMLHTRK